MALVYSKQLLSGSTAGRMIEVNNTTSPGTTLHTVQATATVAREEVYLYAMNGGTATTGHTLTVEWGGTSSADNIVITIPGEDGLYQINPGMAFTATTSIVRALATATGLFRIGGWVNRAT